MCLRIQVSSMWCVCVKRECCFIAVVGLPTPARHRQRSELNHVACKMAANRRAKHEESGRVFDPAGPHFSRPANHFRNAVTVSRYESFVSVCVQGTIKIVTCAPAEDPHEKPRNTRNYKMFRQSGELSDVAQTARRTRKH